MCPSTRVVARGPVNPVSDNAPTAVIYGIIYSDVTFTVVYLIHTYIRILLSVIHHAHSVSYSSASECPEVCLIHTYV